jgi:hypothetical protein
MWSRNFSGPPAKSSVIREEINLQNRREGHRLALFPYNKKGIAEAGNQSPGYEKGRAAAAVKRGRIRFEPDCIENRRAISQLHNVFSGQSAQIHSHIPPPDGSGLLLRMFDSNQVHAGRSRTAASSANEDYNNRGLLINFEEKLGWLSIFY